MLVVILAVVVVVVVAVARRISWAGGNKRQNYCGVWCSCCGGGRWYQCWQANRLAMTGRGGGQRAA